jgi:hypothetical protein
LVFGIDTLSNNQLGSANVFYLDMNPSDPDYAMIYTNFTDSNTGFTQKNIPSYFDSGSNGYFFPDTSIHPCSSSSDAYGFYCTSGNSNGTTSYPISLTATNVGSTGNTGNVSFSVDDAMYMFNTNPSGYAVFNALGGPLTGLFDWGLPFFYGLNVYVGIDTMNKNGPYFAYSSYTAPLGTTNVQTITVNGGPVSGEIIPNIAYTSVTVCVPHSPPPPTTTCQTIDNVLVDTGSSGLRLLSSVLTLSLPAEQIGGGTLGECVQFVDGSYLWGSVQTADVYLGGTEVAHSVPIHVLDSTFSTLPSDCSGTYEADDLHHLGANGILGIAPFQYDCPACASSVISATYYKCP